MTIKGWARRVLLGLPDRPARTFDATPRPIDQMFLEMRGRGRSISRDEALRIPGVLKGRNLVCSFATLPLQEIGPDNVAVRSALLDQIDPNVANVVTLALTIEDLLFEAVAWWRVTGRGFDQFPTSATRIEPWRVSVEPPPGTFGGAGALPSGAQPTADGVWIDGQFVPARDVIRFDSPNPALKVVGAQTFRLLAKYISAAGLYADNPQPSEHFTPAAGAEEHDDDEILEAISAWRAARRNGGTGYVPRWLTYNPNTSPSAADMKLPELKQQATLETALCIGVDPEALGVSTTSRTYANASDWRKDRINDVFAVYMLAITHRLSMGDVTRRGYVVRFDLDDYLRADPTTRWNVYKMAVEMGAMTVQDVQREEGLPVTASAPPTPASAPAAAAASGDELAARRRAAAAFSATTTVEFGATSVGFTVDASTRTVRGIALPWSEIASKFGIKYRFERGSIEFSEVSRVKMLRDHDFTQPLGVATSIVDADGGLDTSFKVARGADGDRAIELAQDGVLDGLSVGVDFDEAADTVPDPDNDGVILIRRATLREVSLTPLPAFDGARVTTVTANRNGGTMHTCPSCGAQMTPGVAHQCAPAQPAQPAPTVQPTGAPAAPTPEQFSAWWQQQQQPTTPAPAGPTVVSPTRTGAAFVRESAPYWVDRKGNVRPGTHEFSTDVFAAIRTGDQAAHDRVIEFARAQFDVVTTDVNELNPTRQRPEMYVDQRDYQYPIWSAIEKGTMTDVTPFTFPKFSSASGMVANHTEGNEPSSGTYVTTSQTVTPSAVSGKMKISRETMDQGGNPQVSALIWRQMVKAWYEALEAFAVSTLDAASPTQIDFSATPGLADEDLDAALTDAFASLQFIRGGFSMDTAFSQIDLYKAMVAATDSSGRRLYPAIGPMNANGTVRGRWAALDVNGVTFLPAWALAASGTVAASSYLFDRDVVHGWASAPQRLDFNIEVANVYIGLWGYKAAAISDINGVREIVYDPA